MHISVHPWQPVIHCFVLFFTMREQKLLSCHQTCHPLINKNTLCCIIAYKSCYEEICVVTFRKPGRLNGIFQTRSSCMDKQTEISARTFTMHMQSLSNTSVLEWCNLITDVVLSSIQSRRMNEFSDVCAAAEQVQPGCFLLKDISRLVQWCLLQFAVMIIKHTFNKTLEDVVRNKEFKFH